MWPEMALNQGKLGSGGEKTAAGEVIKKRANGVVMRGQKGRQAVAKMGARGGENG